MPQLGSTRDLFISAWLSSGNFSSNSSLVSTPPSSMLPYLCLLPSWASLASLMGLLCVLCTALSFSFLGKNRGKNVHFYILFPDFHQPYASLPSYSKAPRLSWAYIGFVAKMKSYYNFFITLDFRIKAQFQINVRGNFFEICSITKINCKWDFFCLVIT